LVIQWDNPPERSEYGTDEEFQDALEEYEEDGPDMTVHETGTMLFGLATDPDDGSVSAMFAAETFWKRNKHVPDQHWGWLLAALYKLPEDFLSDEICENTFMFEYPQTEDSVRTVLETAGLVYSPEMSKMLGGL
jgi:hypothetical protein